MWTVKEMGVRVAAGAQSLQNVNDFEVPNTLRASNRVHWHQGDDMEDCPKSAEPSVHHD